MATPSSVPAWAVVLSLLFVTGGGALAQPVVVENPGRRETSTPGLIVDTGARTAACDVLMFTADGRHLLATGDDKIVRCWRVTESGALKPGEVPTLRWPTFREFRGNIYTAALSPDESRIVVGGHGQLAGGFAAAVIDRKTGKILQGTGNPDGYPQQESIWASAFSPSGNRVALGTLSGTIWLWDLVGGSLEFLGRHERTAEQDDWHRAIRLVAFDGEDRLISVGGNGEMRVWNRTTPQRSELIHTFAGPIATPVVLDAGRRWVGAVLEGARQGGARVEVVSFPDATQKHTITFPGPGDFPHRVAFSPSGRYLAIGIREVGPPGRESGVTFLQERGGRIVIYDLTQLAGGPPALATLKSGLYAEGLAFQPTNEDRLGVAGGENHDVAIWDWKAGRKLGEVPQPGRCLWGVALAPDGSSVAFQEQRHPAAPDPNRRGTGPWRYFSFSERRFLDRPPFEPDLTRQAQSKSGWKVITFDPAQPRALGWSVESPKGDRYPLPWSRSEDEFPRCYAFLPAGPDRPERLAVGHYWGVSLFDLTATGPRRTRILRGHESYVTALSASPDGKRLVTSSRDMTLAGWTLEEWPHHPRVGAELFIRGGKLLVGRVAPGGPFWEMGIEPGDEIVGIRSSVRRAGRVEARNVYVKAPFVHPPMKVEATGSPEEALTYLNTTNDDFIPGNQHLFYWTPNGDKQIAVGATTLIERPLWRFFPHAGQEWVLWQWRDYYYDCSTLGDAAIGWQRNHPRERWRAPSFFRAEQLRGEFLRPERVAKTLASWQSAQDTLVTFNTVEPPEVTVSELKPVPGGHEVTVTARARGTLSSQQPDRLLVWLNDYLVLDTRGEVLSVLEGSVSRTLTIRTSDLRQGTNVVAAQCYSRGQARGDAEPRKILHEGKGAKPTLHGLLVGVGNYYRAKPKPQVELQAAEDVRVLAAALSGQRAKGLFAAVKVKPLIDHQVTRDSVLERLDALADEVNPDDLLIFQLAGHGTSRARLEELRKKRPEIKVEGLGRFLFMCGNFDLARVPDTTIAFEDIHDRLSRLRCHKLILLDACHSGEARTAGGDTDANPVRILTQHGVGSTILAACGPDEEAIENSALDAGQGGAQGLFTIAVRRLLEEEEAFAAADRNNNGRLESAELAAGVVVEVQALLERHNRLLKLTGEEGNDRQTPVVIVPALEELVPIANK